MAVNYKKKTPAEWIHTDAGIFLRGSGTQAGVGSGVQRTGLRAPRTHAGHRGSPRVQTDGANVRRQGAIRLVQRHATSSHYDDDTL